MITGFSRQSLQFNEVRYIKTTYSGAIIAQTGFGGVKFDAYHLAIDIIKAKQIKYLYSKTAQNVNKRYK